MTTRPVDTPGTPLSPNTEKRVHAQLLVELEKVFPKLMKSLEPRDIIWLLRARGFLDHTQMAIINSQVTRHERVQALTAIICKKRFWWGPLTDSLIRAGRPQLASVVMDAVRQGGVTVKAFTAANHMNGQPPSKAPTRSESAPDQGLCAMSNGLVEIVSNNNEKLIDNRNMDLDAIEEEMLTSITVTDDKIVIIKESVSHQENLTQHAVYNDDVLTEEMVQHEHPSDSGSPLLVAEQQIADNTNTDTSSEAEPNDQSINRSEIDQSINRLSEIDLHHASEEQQVVFEQVQEEMVKTSLMPQNEARAESVAPELVVESDDMQLMEAHFTQTHLNGDTVHDNPQALMSLHGDTVHDNPQALMALHVDNRPMIAE